jgi:hypothetical protein
VQDLNYDNIQVRRIDIAGETVEFDWSGISGTVTGNVVGDPVDPGSCLGFKLSTGVGGKSNRGRLYLGAVGRGGLDAFSTAWDLATSPGSTFAGAADVFKADITASGYVWAVYSRKLDQVRQITATTPRSSILSQNPRARRYGVV